MDLVKKLSGYKATDKDMMCRDHQFFLGVWNEVEGDLKMCENGFHFCEYPSGPWSYYGKEGTRIFKVDAEEILLSNRSGANTKCVARRIRLVEEIFPDKDGNTGDQNTGNWNSGNGNTGNFNTGWNNTASQNVGNKNAGGNNIGSQNVGYWNTGSLNVGGDNVGNRNTGHRNTGYGNAGDGNAGHGNTGDGNATDNSSGFLCSDKPLVVCFDVEIQMTRSNFRTKFGAAIEKLSLLLARDEEIDHEDFKTLPGYTPKKLKVLHDKHKARRKKIASD